MTNHPLLLEGMAHKKLLRFAELATFPNVVQAEHPFKGNWNRDCFKNTNEITLEIGCGRGDYTIELAQKFPNRNFIGIDIKGERIWRGAKTALELPLANVIFLRIFVDHISEHFSAEEVSEIWITFADPYPKHRTEKKRLTSPRFLERYQKIIKTGGLLHFKTDAVDFFNYTLKVLRKQNAKIHRVVEDLYQGPIEDEILTIQTTYEKRHLEEGRKIYYVCFGF